MMNDTVLDSGTCFGDGQDHVALVYRIPRVQNESFKAGTLSNDIDYEPLVIVIDILCLTKRQLQMFNSKCHIGDLFVFPVPV